MTVMKGKVEFEYEVDDGKLQEHYKTTDLVEAAGVDQDSFENDLELLAEALGVHGYSVTIDPEMEETDKPTLPSEDWEAPRE